MDNGRTRSQRRNEPVEPDSSDADSSTNNAEQNTSRSPSPPLSRSRRPLRESANQAREYIEDEAELPFDSIHSEKLTRWKEDDICLQYAASNARLPYDVMTDLELEMFADYAIDKVHVNIYIFIRNSILNMWEMNPLMQLVLENVFDEMPSAYKSLSYLIVKTFTFLERYGYINYGVFRTVDEMLKRKEPTQTPNQLKAQKIKIVVVGAGIAGLVAARQLQYFGFNVIVVEARNRIGGRVFSHVTEDGIVFDMGPQFVEGSTGNPLITLLNQVPLTRKRIKFDCPIYNNDEEPFSAKYCTVIESAFRRLAEATTMLARENKVHEIDGKPLSVQDAFDHFVKMQETRVAVERKEFYSAIDQLAGKLEIQSKSLVAAKQVMDNLSNRLQQLLDADPTPIREDFSLIETEAELKRVCQIKFIRYELAKTIEIFEQLQAERSDVFYTMNTVRKTEPTEKYLNERDRRVLGFYYANLELRLGTMLKNVALHSFATPMINNFRASHYSGILSYLFV
ncbi:SWIRM domain-containing protein [Aphelenchoides bicaudatus]|nr:SWIRM domain-containing protein [Aphelenchoides bicaudatus]